MLRSYLQKGADTVSLYNRVMGLWATGWLPNALTAAQRQSVIDAVFAKQRDDGGWSSAMLASWTRADETPQDSARDGYATGLVVLALERAGVSDPRVRRGLDWLSHHQDATTGAWFASSLNKKRDPASDGGKFMIYDVTLDARPLSMTMLARSPGYKTLPLRGLFSGPIAEAGTESMDRHRLFRVAQNFHQRHVGKRLAARAGHLQH